MMLINYMTGLQLYSLYNQIGGVQTYGGVWTWEGTDAWGIWKQRVYRHRGQKDIEGIQAYGGIGTLGHMDVWGMYVCMGAYGHIENVDTYKGHMNLGGIWMNGGSMDVWGHMAIWGMYRYMGAYRLGRCMYGWGCTDLCEMYRGIQMYKGMYRHTGKYIVYIIYSIMDILYTDTYSI